MWRTATRCGCGRRGRHFVVPRVTPCLLLNHRPTPHPCPIMRYPLDAPKPHPCPTMQSGLPFELPGAEPLASYSHSLPWQSPLNFCRKRSFLFCFGYTTPFRESRLNPHEAGCRKERGRRRPSSPDPFKSRLDTAGPRRHVVTLQPSPTKVTPELAALADGVCSCASSPPHQVPTSKGSTHHSSVYACDRLAV